MKIPHIGNERLINLVGLVILALVVLPFIAYSYPPVVGATETYIVQSGSMEPSMSPGAVIFVYDTPATEIEEGDIITYDLQGGERRVTTHRVVDVYRDDGIKMRTKGDANEEVDQYVVPESAVIGKVPILVEDLHVPGIGEIGEYPAKIPEMGQFLIFAGSQWGIAAFVIVPSILLIMSEAYDLFAAYRAARNTGSGQGEEAP